MYHPISRGGMIEVDRIMVDELGIEVELMMEHAGVNLAMVCVVKAKKFNLNNYVVVAGNGNNGGGGIVCARKLHGWGKKVILWLPRGEPTRDVPKRQLDIAQTSGVDVVYNTPYLDDSLVVDALIGYNFRGRLNEETIAIIDTMRLASVVSLDLPSGVDGNTGRNDGGLIPTTIVTLAWPKDGLLNFVEQNLSELYLVDIGVPNWIYQREGVLEKSKQPDNEALRILGDFFAKSSVNRIKLDYTNRLWST